MPNTFIMQEIARQEFDYYVELEEAGQDVEPPLIFRIPKGRATGHHSAYTNVLRNTTHKESHSLSRVSRTFPPAAFSCNATRR